jgi:hypothetical protein
MDALVIYMQWERRNQNFLQEICGLGRSSGPFGRYHHRLPSYSAAENGNPCSTVIRMKDTPLCLHSLQHRSEAPTEIPFLLQAIMDNPSRMKSIMFMSSIAVRRIQRTRFSIKLRDECITFQVSGSDSENTNRKVRKTKVVEEMFRKLDRN